MKKLVRDKIPEFATYASYRQLKPEEREDALKNKIVEEANEVKLRLMIKTSLKN